MKSVADSGHSCQTQRSDSKKSRICTLGNGFERLRGQAVRPKISSTVRRALHPALMDVAGPIKELSMDREVS